MKRFLLRKEYFGGTLFSVQSGKRTYVNRSEFQMIEQSGIVPVFLNDEMGDGNVKIVYPKILPESNFSFPDTIFMEITRSCNISCSHCFNNSGKRLTDELEVDEMITVIKNIASLGAQEVRFTGGEPLVFSKMFDLIKEATDNNLRVSIGTNATLINREKAISLSETGLSMAVVSIDGLKKTHDAIRGDGNFDKSIAGIYSLINREIAVRVNIVAMKSNLKDIPEVVKLFHGIGVNVFVRRFIPLGRSATHSQGLSLEHNDYAWLREELASYIDDKNGNIQGHHIKEISVVPRINLSFERNKCSALQRGLVITPNGNVQVCGFINYEETGFLGNIQNESLTDIWKGIISGNLALKLDKKLKLYNQGKKIKTNCYAIAICNRKEEK